MFLFADDDFLHSLETFDAKIFEVDGGESFQVETGKPFGKKLFECHALFRELEILIPVSDDIRDVFVEPKCPRAGVVDDATFDRKRGIFVLAFDEFRSHERTESEQIGSGKTDVKRGIGFRDGETTLKELEAKVGFAARYRRVQEKLEELEQLVIDTRFECTSPYASLNTTQYAKTLTRMLELIRSIDEVNES